ncbi:Uncharacterised protein [uncultured archaeon]|nr:Uncharacterised protein [uncultured archaeon]
MSVDSVAIGIVDFAADLRGSEGISQDRAGFAKIVKGKISRMNRAVDDRVSLFLCDWIFLLSAMTGRDPVFDHILQPPITITPEKPELLRLLRIRGNQDYLWPDKRLYDIFNARESGKKCGLPGYRQVINHLGNTGEVKAYYGCPVSYSWVSYKRKSSIPDGCSNVRVPLSRIGSSNGRRINDKIII